MAHTVIITGATGCGKTEFVMKKLMKDNFFDVVLVICPTFKFNSTYQKYYDKTFKQKSSNLTHYYHINPRNTKLSVLSKSLPNRLGNLQEWITALSDTFHDCGQILFLIDDMAADEQIVKKKSALTELAISGRHTNRSLWVITQKYNAIVKDVREQAMWIVSFWTKDKKSFEAMIEENYIKGLNYDINDQLSNKRYSYLWIKCSIPSIYSIYSISI